MKRLHNTIKIDASPEKVWKVLGDPAATHLWIPGLTNVKVDGNLRVCTTADGNEIHEEIEYSDESHSFRYNQLKVPLPVKISRGVMMVKPEGNCSLVIWKGELEALDPAREVEVISMIDGYYKQTLESPRMRIESMP